MDCNNCDNGSEANRIYLCDTHNPSSVIVDNIDTESCDGDYSCGYYCRDCKYYIVNGTYLDDDTDSVEE